MKDYERFKNKISEDTIDTLINFVRTEKEAAKNSSKLVKATGGFFRALTNLLAGDHKIHSFREAREVIKYYCFYASDLERDDNKTTKILTLFDELSTVPRESKPGKNYTSHIERVWIEKIKTKIAEQPRTIAKARNPDDYSFTLVDPKKLPPVTAKLLFQIEADEFGLNSGLEGTQKKIPLEYVLGYIQERVSHGDHLCANQDQLIHELQVAYAIASSSNIKETLGEAIKIAFAKNEPLLIPGGWVGIPSGHAVYYELIPDKENKATLRIFNTGEGVQNHQQFQVGVRDKIRYAEWTGISQNRFLDPHFAEIIEEMNTHMLMPEDANQRTEYSARDIYTGIRSFLEVKEFNRINEDVALQAPLVDFQKAGTCTYKSLLSFLKAKMGLNEFRRFKCDIRIQALVSELPLAEQLTDEVRTSREKQPLSNRGTWRLVQKSVQSTSRKLNRLYDKNVIGATYLKQAHTVLKPVGDWIEQKKGEVFEAAPLESIPTYKGVKNNIGLNSSIEAISTGKVSNDKASSLQALQEVPCSHLIHQMRKYTFKSPLTIRAEIKAFKQLLEAAQSNKEFRAINHAVVDLAKRLNIEPGFWQQIPGSQEELEDLVEDLNVISQSFFSSCYRTAKPDCVFPEQQYAVLKLLNAQAQIMSKKYPEISINVDTEINNTRFYFFHSQDELIEQEMERMLSLYDQNSQKTQLFNYGSFIDAYNKSHLRIVFDKRQRKEQLKGFLQQHYPQVFETVSQENPFYTTASEEDRLVYLISSPSLPSWLKGLRDSRLRFSYLMKAHVVPPIEEGAAFNLIFSTDRKSNPIDIIAKIEGIDQNSLEILPYEKRESNRERDPQSAFREYTTQPMKKLVEGLTQRAYRNYMSDDEKQLVARKFKNTIKEFSEEKSKEILHPFFSDEYRLIETVEYFTRYPERLKEADFQQIFQMSLFGFYKTLLVSQEDSIAEIIGKFVVKQFKHYAAQNDMGTAVFLLRMNRGLSHYQKFKPYTIDGLEQVKGLLSNKGLLPEERSILSHELTSLLAEKEELTKEEITDLLLATITTSDQAIPAKWEEPKYDWEKQKALQKHSKAIEELLSPNGVPNQAILNQLYEETKGKKAASEWKSVQNEGQALRLVTSTGDVYDPIEGRLFTLNKQTSLPNDILQNSHFKILFPSQKKGEALPGDIYQFNDDYGHRILVKKGRYDGVLIEQERNEERYLFQSPKALEQETNSDVISNLSSRYLIDKYSHWRSLSDPMKLILINRENNKEEYHVILVDPYVEKMQKIMMGGMDLFISKIIRISDKALLNAPSNLFKRFESPGYIHEWFSETGELLEIELPRFSLTFKKSGKKLDRLECVQHPGWLLAKEQSISALGGCTYSLLFDCPDGKQRFLLPNQEIESPEEKEVLEPRFRRKQELEKGKYATFNCYSYELDINGMPQTESRAAALQLVETLAAHQQYDLAAKYLRQHGEKLSPYTTQEAAHLERIYKIGIATGDESGEQNGIKLYAAYLLATNPIHSKEAIKQLPEFYQKYLSHFHHTTSLILNKEEELRLLKNILEKNYEPHFVARLQELDFEYAAQLANTEKKSLQSVKTAHPKEILKKMNLYYNRNPKETQRLLTRAGSEIKSKLHQYITQAIQGTPEEKKWLHDATTFLLASSSLESQAFGVLFQEILKNPDKFTIPPAGRHSDVWWKDTVDLLGDQKLNSASPLSEITPSLSSSNYRLEGAVKESPTFLFLFAVIDMRPLEFVLIPLMREAANAALEVRGVLQNPELKQWMANQKDTVADKDPLQFNEWERLSADYAYYLNHAHTLNVNSTFFDQLSLNEISRSLKNQETLDQRLIQDLERQMNELANHLPSLDDEALVAKFNRMGNKEKSISLDDIFISLAKRDPNSLKVLNPALNQEEMYSLYAMAGDYLQLVSRSHQMKRVQANCEKLLNFDQQGSTSEKNELQKQFLTDLLAKRAYEIKNHPEYLVFEFYAEILMRKEQVEKLDQFLSGKTVNPVMEMIMGSGKSKVLLPLLGLIRANGKDLSMLIVPAPLFESVSGDTQKIMKKAFGKSLRTLYFDRNTTFTKRSLEDIRDTLQEVIKNKECLIMTSKSVQSLILKFVDQAENAFERDIYLTDEILLMQEIVALLNKCGTPLIDEVDTVLNVLHEVSFSIGNKSAPKNYEIHLIKELYNLLYTDPKLKAIASLESDPKPNPNAPPLTEENYYTTLQGPLTKAILDRLKVASLRDKVLDAELQKYLHELKGRDEELLLAYLRRDKSKAQESLRYIKTLPENLQEIFALLGEELSHLLPHSLTRIDNQNYGLDKDVLAIPYKATGIPVSGSQFSNPYITMNYTFQTHFRNGIDKPTINEQISKLQKRALIEIEDSGGSLLVTDTEAWKKFCALKGDLPIPLFNFSDSQVEELVHYINASPNTVQNVIGDVFLTQLELFDLKMACKTFGFTSLFNKLCGFTGTLWNANSMDRKITPQPEMGTDAKTINLLWSMGKDNVYVIPKGSTESLLETIGSTQVKFDMISDAGGYFKDGSNLTIARKLAIKQGKPVVFYNDRGEQTLTDGKKEQPLDAAKISEDNRLTFLDQSHTTGSDVKQRMEAVGFVTIGRNMLLRDLLQSVWRLRGLEKGQKVKFLIDEDVESIIKNSLKLAPNKELQFAEILQFVISNQSKQQGNDNFKAFKDQVWNMPQSLLIDVLLTEKISPRRRKRIYGMLRETWIKPTQLSAKALYGSPAMERPKSEVINEEVTNCKQFLDEVAAKFPLLSNKCQQYKARIDALAESIQNIVHPLIISPIADDSETVEIENEVQVEMQVEVEVETQVISEEENVKLGKSEGRFIQEIDSLDGLKYVEGSYKLPVISMEKLMDREAALKEFAPYFKDIKVSVNILEWKDGEKNLDKYQLFGPHRTPYHHLKVENDEVSLFSLIELYREFIKPNYNLYLGFTDGSKNQLTQKAFEKITKLKFLNGESNYNKEELAFLDRWIREAGRTRMLRLFGLVLNNQPDKRAAFQGSPLQKIFSKE